LITPTVPPATQAKTISKSKLRSKTKEFAKNEKLENANATYKKPKTIPLIKPFDSPFIAIIEPIKTLIVFINKFSGEINFSLSENHFKENANKIMRANETSIETIKPFKKLTNKLAFESYVLDFENDIILPLQKIYATKDFL
jgi:hypothetical protein